MNDYFDQVEHEIRDAVRRRAHMPWYARPLGVRQGRALAVVLVAAVVAAGAVVVIAVSGNTRQAGVRLTTQQVIARTAAFVTGSGSGILHVDSTTTSSTKNGRHHASVTFDRWSEEKPPYDYRVSSTDVQETKVGNTLIAYRSDFNQISVGNLRTGPVPIQMQDPLTTAIAGVDAVHGVGTFSPKDVTSPASFARALARIITEPGVTVTETVFRGTRVTGITSANKRTTLYVHPGTYRPQALITKIPVCSEATPPRCRTAFTETTVFHSYETLPRTSLKMPNLVLSYPHATVAPWERHYWKRYWSQASSGNAQTRRQALDDLHNK